VEVDKAMGQKFKQAVLFLKDVGDGIIWIQNLAVAILAFIAGMYILMYYLDPQNTSVSIVQTLFGVVRTAVTVVLYLLTHWSFPLHP
jgi:hypothetical protein